MYWINSKTRSVWYKWNFKEEMTFKGYEKDYLEIFDTLKISPKYF